MCRRGEERWKGDTPSSPALALSRHHEMPEEKKRMKKKKIIREADLEVVELAHPCATSVQSRESMAHAHASVRDACAPNRLAPLQLTWSKGGFKPYIIHQLDQLQQAIYRASFKPQVYPYKQSLILPPNLYSLLSIITLVKVILL